MKKTTKIKKFTVNLLDRYTDTITGEVHSKVLYTFTQEYVKGVLLRTAWRDAILRLQKEDELPEENKLQLEHGYSLEVIPHLFLVDEKDDRPEGVKEHFKNKGKKKTPSKEELAALRKELEKDASMGEGEEEDDEDGNDD